MVIEIYSYFYNPDVYVCVIVTNEIKLAEKN